MARTPETALYAPVKMLLEGQGYDVKGEIGAADVVACRKGEPPVIVELKAGFSLKLLHQGVARLALCDCVYVAVPRPAKSRTLKDNIALCRRLGLGVMTVRMADGFVEVHADPGPYRPRADPKGRARLLREFQRRAGDPNIGGAARRGGVVTAYRQDALRIAAVLADGPLKGAVVARTTGVTRATRIMADDYYGWFERVSKGVYQLTPRGRTEVLQKQKSPE